MPNMSYLTSLFLSRGGVSIGLIALWALAGNHIEWVTPIQIFFFTWLLWHLLRIFWPVLVIVFLLTHSQYLQH